MIAARVPMSHSPPAYTATKVPAQISPINARPRIRRRPSTSFTIGSCASATTAADTNQSTPIEGSLTCAVFLANGGNSSDMTAIPAPMKMTFTKMYAMNVPLRSTSAYRPGS